MKTKQGQRLQRSSKAPWVGLLSAVGLLFVGCMLYAGVTGVHPSTHSPAAATAAVTDK